MLDELAENAFDLYSVGHVSASDAVKVATKTSSLNPEQVSRVCTMVNRKIHSREKVSHGAGGLWRSRWDTAKPEDILGKQASPYDRWETTKERVRGISSAAGEKKSSANVVDLNTLKPKYSSEIIVEAEGARSYETSEDFSKVASAAVDVMQDSWQTALKGIQEGEGRVARAELEAESARAEFVETLLAVKELTPGELVTVAGVLTKESQVIDAVLKRTLPAYIDADALLGDARDRNGDLVVEKNSEARVHASIRPAIRNITLQDLNNHLPELVKVAEDYERAVEELELLAEALDTLREEEVSMRAALGGLHELV